MEIPKSISLEGIAFQGELSLGNCKSKGDFFNLLVKVLSSVTKEEFNVSDFDIQEDENQETSSSILQLKSNLNSIRLLDESFIKISEGEIKSNVSLETIIKQLENIMIDNDNVGMNFLQKQHIDFKNINRQFSEEFLENNIKQIQTNLEDKNISNDVDKKLIEDLFESSQVEMATNEENVEINVKELEAISEDKVIKSILKNLDKEWIESFIENKHIGIEDVDLKVNKETAKSNMNEINVINKSEVSSEDKKIESVLNNIDKELMESLLENNQMDIENVDLKVNKEITESNINEINIINKSEVKIAENILDNVNKELGIDIFKNSQGNVENENVKEKRESVQKVNKNEVNDLVFNNLNIGLEITEEELKKNFGINKINFEVIQQLNKLSKNNNISSNLQNMILSLENGVENKEILNLLKFLENYTNKDGSLNLDSMFKKVQEVNRNTEIFFNNFNQNSNLTTMASKLTKEVNIFKSSDIVDVVIENFKHLRLPGRCEMTIKLNPKELGEITLRLVLEKGDISASISTNKKETFMLLQSNISTFLDQLKTSESGISHLSINLNQDQDQSGEGARRGYQNNKEDKERREFEEVFMESLEEESMNIEE